MAGPTWQEWQEWQEVAALPRVIEMAPIVSLMEIHIASDLVGDTGIEPVTSSV